MTSRRSKKLSRALYCCMLPATAALVFSCGQPNDLDWLNDLRHPPYVSPPEITNGYDGHADVSFNWSSGLSGACGVTLFDSAGRYTRFSALSDARSQSSAIVTLTGLKGGSTYRVSAYAGSCTSPEVTFSESDGVWRSVADLPFSFSYPKRYDTFGADSNLFFYNSDYSAYDDPIWKYNPETDAWSSYPLTGGPLGMMAFSGSAYYFFLGGSIQRLTPSTGVFENLHIKPQGMLFFFADSSGIYWTNAYWNSSSMALWKSSFSASLPQQLNPLPASILGAWRRGVHLQLGFFGGANYLLADDTVWKYEAPSDTWTGQPATNPSWASMYIGVTSRFLCFAHYRDSTVTIDGFDPKTNQWSHVVDLLPENRLYGSYAYNWSAMTDGKNFYLLYTGRSDGVRHFLRCTP